MQTIGKPKQVLCIFFAAMLLAADGHGSGRRLRLRGQGHKATGTQWPTKPMDVFSSKREPIVNFLFLAVDRVNNIGIWNAFFAAAPQDRFRAYVHCKTPMCFASVAQSALVPVASVPSFYCADLVSPMNQLLSEALGGPGSNPSDKFVFVSDSTLPAKPFAQIYSSLSQRSGSDFCVCSMKEWATRTPDKAGDASEIAVKHHQWSVLERSHAEHVVQLWQSASPLVHDFLLRFQMNLPPRSRSVKTFAGGNDAGCLDEFYHMAAIFGTIPYTGTNNNSAVNLPEFTNNPLQISPGSDLQGSCDTFAAWPDFAVQPSHQANESGSNAFKRLYASLDALSRPYTGTTEKPGYWDAISSRGLRAIRDSDFFFVRKFTDHPRITDGGDFGSVFSQIVLA